MRYRLATARVAHLATVDLDAGVHLVPCVLVLDGDTVYIPTDHKPKRTRVLRRLANLERDPRVVLLVDHYDEDWVRLWWVRVRGVARVLRDGAEVAAAAMRLRAKYRQYEAVVDAELTPVVAVDIVEWRGWAAWDGGAASPP